MVVGPAGYGKTVLARQVAGAWDGAVAWLDVDDLHVDTDWLVDDLVAAIERVEPGFLPEPDDGTSIEERAAHVASALSGRRMFLVVDRCERIADRAAALSVLSTIIEYMPGDTRMLLLSRGELGGPFSRMLLQGDLGRMAGDELELDDDEATRFLDALGVTEDRAAIANAVGGWIAAMIACGRGAHERRRLVDGVLRLPLGRGARAV